MDSGCPSEALVLAREHMTPIVDKDPALLPILKASMTLLLPGPPSAPSMPSGGKPGAAGVGGDGAWVKGTGGMGNVAPDVEALSAKLAGLLQEGLGVQEPRLLVLIRELMGVHKAWLKSQRCADPFGNVLGLDQLKVEGLKFMGGGGGPKGVSGGGRGEVEGAGALPLDLLEMLVTDREEEAGGQRWGGEEDEAEDEDGAFDEGAILQVMEIVEVPRSTAMELLAQHGGSAERVINELFGV